MGAAPCARNPGSPLSRRAVISENRLRTPRRLAVKVESVARKQKSIKREVIGPPAKVGFDENGKPTMAAQKFAEKVGIKVSRLKTKKTEKGNYLFAKKVERVRLDRFAV